MPESQAAAANKNKFLVANWRNDVCSFDGGQHKIGIVKNCSFFSPEHPEFLHCLSCEALRCIKCGDIVLENSQVDPNLFSFI